MIFKKALINFAMIQTVIAATSINVGVHLIPSTEGAAQAVAFIWILTFLCTFLPAIAVSFVFAHFNN